MLRRTSFPPPQPTAGPEAGGPKRVAASAHLRGGRSRTVAVSQGRKVTVSEGRPRAAVLFSPGSGCVGDWERGKTPPLLVGKSRETEGKANILHPEGSFKHLWGRSSFVTFLDNPLDRKSKVTMKVVFSTSLMFREATATIQHATTSRCPIENSWIRAHLRGFNVQVMPH